MLTDDPYIIAGPAVIDTFKEGVGKVEAQRKRLADLDNYVQGIFKAPFVPDSTGTDLAREYNALIKMAELPICGLIISAVTDRIRVDGVKSSLNETQSIELWRWWQNSHLDSRQLQLYRDSLTFANAYLLITPPTPTDEGAPRLTPETPLNMYVEHDPYDPLSARWAIKTVANRGWLYTADNIYSLERPPNSETRWTVVATTPHAAGICPIVRFPNRLDSAGRADSEITQVLPIQRRINQTILTRLLLETSAAWRQRWVSGLNVEKDANGNPISPFSIGVDKLLIAPDPETKFGEYAASTTQDLLSAVEQDLRHIAVVTQTPPTLFAVQSISNISAESLAALEGGLMARVDQKQVTFGEAFELAMRIAGRMVGMDVPEDLEMSWASLELQSNSQRADALLKFRQAGLPMRFLLEDILGLTPQTVQRVINSMAEEQDMGARAQATAFGVTHPNTQPVTDQTASNANPADATAIS